MDALIAELRKIPPVTRFACVSLVAVTVPVLLKVVSPYKILYRWDLVARRWEVWRLWTSFFLGSGGIGFLFELSMFYRTCDQLESGPYAHKSADLAWQLTLACASIIVTSIPMNGMLFFRPLLLCVTYLSSSLAPADAQTSLFGLLTFPVKYTPYMMLGMDLLMGGPAAAAQSLPGAVVGHLWWWSIFGSGEGGAGNGALQGLATAPRWVARWFGNENADASRGVRVAGGVHVVPPRAAAASSATRSSGYNWGSGQRLGDS